MSNISFAPFHTLAAERGDTKHVQTKQITGGSAQRILPSIFWLREKDLLASVIVSHVTRPWNCTTGATIGNDWSPVWVCPKWDVKSP